MVRATFFASAVLAMVAFVSAAPSVVNANVGHVGLGDVNMQKSFNEFLHLHNLCIEDVLEYIKLL